MRHSSRLSRCNQIETHQAERLFFRIGPAYQSTQPPLSFLGGKTRGRLKNALVIVAIALIAAGIGMLASLWYSN